MRNTYLDFKLLLILGISFLSGDMYAQLGFCQGNSGDPIFTEDFGSGTNYGPALPVGTTTYSFIGNSGPQDGQYTIGRNTFSYGWSLPSDHTGDTNGKALIVNASFTTGEFYNIAVNGLCENTTYEFSSWLINILPITPSACGGNGIPINVQFEIWDNTDTNLLASGDTGSIFSSSTPTWEKYGLVFQTLVGQTSVILKMKNNSVGGCGNDLAIDDIVFRTCGDSIDVSNGAGNNSVTICSSQAPFSDTLTAFPDNSVFTNHFYQWQTSTDGTNWNDISGEINPSINVSGITSTTYFRAKVAEFAANLSNADCLTFSDVYEININQGPTPPTIECWETLTLDAATCTWIVTGTQPAEPTGLECWETTTFNTSTCVWDITGTQPTHPTIECWETATFNTALCDWEVSGTQPIEPTGLECWETTAFNNTLCSWEVTGSQPIRPTVKCWEVTTFNSTTCIWETTGTQPEEPIGLECWEVANFNETICIWEITGTEPVEPTDLLCWQTAIFDEANCKWVIQGTEPIEFKDEFLSICENESITLIANSAIVNPSYQWVSGEMTSSIDIGAPGIYEVEITDSCFTEIITFNVALIETPIIESVVSDGSSILVNLMNSGSFQYSIDGINYQFSNIFSNLPSGLYTIYIKSDECDVIVTQEHFHFFIQKFMSPNGDGVNDSFDLNITQFFASTEVYIFNRYGKLLYSAINSNVNWDGTFNGNDLPTSDYWYRIVLDNQQITGHFTLKR